MHKEEKIHVFNTLFLKVTLPKYININQYKLKVCADDKIRATEKLKFVKGSVENIVEKRTKCWLPAFSPFPTMFSKNFFLKVIKSRNCVVKS